MKIAVAYKDEEIFEHFGHAETFAIYDYDLNTMLSTKKLVSCEGLHGHADMAELVKKEGVDAVIVGRMGDEARAMLLSYGIVPVAGYCGHADTAAELLVTGQLPIYEGDGACSGGCGGDCGGCGGCHHDGEEDGECGCGCGCGGSGELY